MSKFLLQKKATKAYAFAVIQEKRLGRFTRISQSALDRWEARLKLIINEDVHRHPSLGKTLK